jgi:hypothetical protein
MAQQDQFIREYYSLNGSRVIDCPSQPGNLKILERACLKRLKAADRIIRERYNSTNTFSYFVSQGLLRCKECLVIKQDKIER